MFKLKRINRRVSQQRSKQRKRHFQAPDHLRLKIMSSGLSKELKDKYKKRTCSIRKGDTVKVISGEHKGLSGKVNRVNRGNFRIYVDGISKKKQNGDEYNCAIHPSRCQIIELYMDNSRQTKLEKGLN
eukprot:GAHX01000433.1.p1 GENE.GAHX01000433.1~~GAHX01000433.1.p1  ORF type:complete len:138 (-),score=25.21 GAHX01000433.1:32-415(-)